MNEPNTAAPETEELTEQQVSELIQIRRDKLAALRDDGQDPFQITKYDVTERNADIRACLLYTSKVFRL